MMTGFWDTLAGVAFTAALLATGWVVKQLFTLTTAVATVTTMVQSLQDDHADRLDRIENHLWGPRAIMGPPGIGSAHTPRERR